MAPKPLPFFAALDFGVAQAGATASNLSRRALQGVFTGVGFGVRGLAGQRGFLGEGVFETPRTKPKGSWASSFSSS